MANGLAPSMSTSVCTLKSTKNSGRLNIVCLAKVLRPLFKEVAQKAVLRSLLPPMSPPEPPPLWSSPLLP